MNVCVFGDSISRGVVLDAVKKRYQTLRESFASLASSLLGFELNNYSKFGCTVDKGLELVERHAGEISRARYTVLEFGGNDCDQPWKEISLAPLGSHLPKTPIDDFAARYREMIDAVREDGGRPVLLNLPPIDPQRYFDWISRGLSAQNILDWLGGDVNYIYRWHEMYSIAVELLAQREGVPLIDIRTPFLRRRDCFSLLCEDGIHPNAEGHALISAVIESRAAEVA